MIAIERRCCPLSMTRRPQCCLPRPSAPDLDRIGALRHAAPADREDAIKLLDTASEDYKALITDINLVSRKLTGWDVAKHARQLVPNMPVVYMSGFAGHEWASMGVPNSIMLEKPFAPHRS